MPGAYRIPLCSGAYRITAELPGFGSLTVTLDEKRFPERVHSRTGTTEIENIYSGYKDWDLSDIYFPSRIVQKRGGQTVFDLTVTNCTLHQPVRGVSDPRKCRRSIACSRPLLNDPV